MTDELPCRLMTVVSMIDPDRARRGRVIDVGSDHGLLALYCLKNELTPFCVCTDIHEKPALRTRECLAGKNYANRSQVFCTDGLDGVDLLPCDNVVMAGLGGNTAISVMERAMSATSPEVLAETDFILQPQKSQDEVRVFLFSRGFKIIDETACIDRGLFYICMRVRYDGVVRELAPEDKYFGPLLRLKSDETSLAYIAHLKTIYGLRRRGNPELDRLMEEYDA